MKTVRMTLLMKLVFVAFVLFSLITILQLRMRFHRLQEQTQEVMAQIEICEDNIERLSEQLDEKFDEEYVEQYAREQGYCKPDEFVVYNDR